MSDALKIEPTTVVKPTEFGSIFNASDGKITMIWSKQPDIKNIHWLSKPRTAEARRSFFSMIS